MKNFSNGLTVRRKIVSKSLATVFINLIITLQVNAQSVVISIDKSVPHPSSILDVQSSSKGMLLPRTSTISRNAIPTPAKGLILYDTTVSAFLFYNGSAWGQVLSDNTGWSLTGNAISGTKFIGTTNSQPLRFRVNNNWAGEIHPNNGNIFFGLNAGNATTTGNGNIAVGEHSLLSNTGGYLNTALGNYALSANTGGLYNAAVGSNALRSNTTGGSNAALGAGALYSNTTGLYNTASGATAMYYSTAGNRNTATGAEALYNNNAAASDNTANGYGALSNNSGNENTAVGATAMLYNTVGYQNTALGVNALLYNVGGNNNIAIGANAGTHSNSPYVFNTISIGNNNLLNAYQNQVFIGNTHMGWIGGQVTWSTYSDERIKNTITEDVKGLNFILKLRPVTYYINQQAIATLTGNKATPDFPGKYDNEKVKYTGFLAQEVEKAAKDAGYDFSGYAAPKNQYGLYSISYEQFVVPLVKAMQEQQALIDKLINQLALPRGTATGANLQAIITSQQKQIDLLEKRLAALEASSKRQ